MGGGGPDPPPPTYKIVKKNSITKEGNFDNDDTQQC